MVIEELTDVEGPTTFGTNARRQASKFVTAIRTVQPDSWNGGLGTLPLEPAANRSVPTDRLGARNAGLN